MALTDLNFRSNAHNFQLVSENCKITAGLVRNCELKQHKTNQFALCVSLPRNAQIQHDYQYSTQRSTRVWRFTAMLWEICSLFFPLASYHSLLRLVLACSRHWSDMRIAIPPSPTTWMLSWGWCCFATVSVASCWIIIFFGCQFTFSPTTTFSLFFGGGASKVPSVFIFYGKHERAKFLTMFRDKIPGKFMSSIQWRWL